MQCAWRPTTLDIQHSPEGSVKRRAAEVSKIKEHTGWEAKISAENLCKEMVESDLKLVLEGKI